MTTPRVTPEEALAWIERRIGGLGHFSWARAHFTELLRLAHLGAGAEGWEREWGVMDGNGDFIEAQLLSREDAVAEAIQEEGDVIVSRIVSPWVEVGEDGSRSTNDEQEASDEG